MEAGIAYVLLGVVFAFSAAMLLSQPLIENVKKHDRTMRIQDRMVGQTKPFDSVIRNGVPWFRWLGNKILVFEKVQKAINNCVVLFEEKGYHTASVSLASLCLAGMTFCALIFLFLSGSIFFALVGTLCCMAIVMFSVMKELDSQKYALRDSIPDALRSLSVCFGAGLSLHQTFQQVASELKGPLRVLFLEAASEFDAGNTVECALRVFKKSSNGELSFVAAALDIQHKTGGSMQQVLDTACEVVESEISLERSLKVQTAQAKMSAHVVSIMPLILVAIFSFLSEDFLLPFFQSFAGFALLALAILMQVGGILLVRKVLKVEVS